MALPRTPETAAAPQRQERIDRLQQRVQRLQSEQPQGERAQRAQQRSLQAQERLLRREQQLQQRELARQERTGQGEQQRVERQQAIQERQRDVVSRQNVQRQERIDRLQQRVQRLQSELPQGERAQRAQQRSLQAQERLLRREQQLQQRELARQERLGIQPSAREPGAIAAAQAAARGRFTERFRNTDDPRTQTVLEARRQGWAPRDAWRRGHRAVFVAWLGPVFWPYAYTDIFNYTFWPYAYDTGYWAYAYDDLLDTVYWGESGPYSAYASLVPGEQARSRALLSKQEFRQLCGDPEGGITAWPFDSIVQAVQPTPEQRALLDELKSAAARAADEFKQSCSDSYAMTPPGRLRAMTNRISATLDAVRIVRPVLEKYYSSLSDEQQARFNAIGPELARDSKQQPQQDATALADTCGEPKSGLTSLPIERIESVVRPAGTQKEGLERLREATLMAVQGLQAACPDDVPLTPVGRLEAMEKRLEAMLQAARLVQPALDEFYATLSSEQKARFNSLKQFAGR